MSWRCCPCMEFVALQQMCWCERRECQLSRRCWRRSVARRSACASACVRDSGTHREFRHPNSKRLRPELANTLIASRVLVLLFALWHHTCGLRLDPRGTLTCLIPGICTTDVNSHVGTKFANLQDWSLPDEKNHNRHYCVRWKPILWRDLSQRECVGRVIKCARQSCDKGNNCAGLQQCQVYVQLNSHFQLGPALRPS